jgi:hypothetical protein
MNIDFCRTLYEHRTLSTTTTIIKMAAFRTCMEERIPKLLHISGDSTLKDLLLRNFYKNRWVNRSFILDWNLELLKRRGKRLTDTTTYYVNNSKWLRESIQLPSQPRTNANRRLNIMNRMITPSHLKQFTQISW